ncbi:MFS transporter, putative metabolite:H+ symporter [Actinopolyspora lacussalsi subsp. righensis]|uniref:MFS transporter, putative metabolite:H+ symporter n=1 Tax=Actinopolyspora righensis TaxID=995060 RepID=A0A1I6XC88_9ACTN|nr:MFS transporter [Actinopolyspora righensis]SFT35858.1 MFS transporter, putative metabolite:H+ symporter [Actinopolyspora righensis]
MPAKLANALLLCGTAIVLISSGIGFVAAFTMDMPATESIVSQASQPLHGMPLSQMPEMFVAPVGLLLVLLGGAFRSTSGRQQASVAHVGRRGRAVIAVLGTAALTIDISKTSTLGFVIPGMRAEYGLEAETASLLAVSGLMGTATGAVLYRVFTDRIGLRLSYLLATLGFTATSMCGSMPTFAGNVVMCGLMGVTVGGLAPLVINVLSDTASEERRGAVVVALSVIATAAGYLVAAGSALWLEPIFGWRVLWLIGAPTGMLLVASTPWIPERSVRRSYEVRHESGTAVHTLAFSGGLQRLYALLVGVLTFGLTTWVPTLARSGGVPIPTANLLLTVASVIMLPCSLLILLGYRRFGPVRLAAGLAGFTAVLLLGLAASGAVSVSTWLSAFVLAAALFAVNIMAAIFLPIVADLADAASRTRMTGTVSLYNRLGGLSGPLLLGALVSSVTDVLVAVSALAAVCAGLAGYLGRQYRRVRSPGNVVGVEGAAESSSNRSHNTTV